MEAIILVILQYGLAAVLGGGALKGGEFAVKKYRANKEDPPEISAVVCRMKHDGLEDKLTDLKEDLSEVKDVLGKLVQLQIELVSLKGELRHEIDEKMSGHISDYHKAA